MKLAHLSWHKAEPILQNPDTLVVIPVGSTEQHGPVGPLGTDWLIPEWIVNEMEKRCDILATPVVPFGVATHHTSFPGTIDMGLDTMTGIFRGIFESLTRHGARRFLIVNGHGGNDPAIERAGLEIARKTGALVALLNWWSIAPQLNPEWTTGHGDAPQGLPRNPREQPLGRARLHAPLEPQIPRRQREARARHPTRDS